MDKKILFIAHDGGVYGANQSLINIVSGLISNGIFVLVVFPVKGSICDIFDTNKWDYIVVNYRTELKPKQNSYFDFIKNFLRKYYTKWINLFALFKLIKIVNKFNINIIHSNSSVVSIGYNLSKIKSINHVWHLREYIHPNYDLFVYDGLEKYKNKVKNSKNKICITKGVANEFGLEHKAFILKDAVRKKPKFTKPVIKSNYFLFCGALKKSKGIEEAINVFYKLFLVNKSIKLLIVGEGNEEYEFYLKNKINDLGLINNVNFLGFRKDVDELMSKAIALLMCSRNEALGRVTIEAMINFCIVFGYNDSGTSEIIEHGKTGLLYNSEDELYNYMLRIINFPNEFMEITNLAYNYALDNFLEDKFSQKLIDYYENLN